MFDAVVRKLHALTVRPRMHLGLFLLRFLPSHVAIVKGRNESGEVCWYVVTEDGKHELVYLPWEGYAQIVREEYLKQED